jgi:hypothetical protein
LDFGFEEKIQFPGKEAPRAPCAFGHRLNASQGFRAPRNDQAGVTELAFP